MNQLGVVVVAAGKGLRMGTKESKQYLRLNGKPILVHTLEVFNRMQDVDEVVLVVGADDVERCETYVRDFGLTKVKHVIAGGSERQHSVYQGLAALNTDWVLVHDGVRPLIREEDALRCLQGARQSGAAVLAVPVKDTIKIVNEVGVITTTPDRKSLWAIQTPQAFRRLALMAAHEDAAGEGFLGTDDAMLAERAGTEVHVVEGDYTNIKITTPEDLDWAEYLLGKRGAMN
ncbi:2-C-methyl-D-erythritol 4-phosphate cytidylyltransferase [Paenibacillus swuensis]|uniref:2-C-methyl-D-erythritol 4-phosphate cytidylyltransferase n=1 Tax=Paenibacillus swuensis TaxID=1178515 RepID=A0A172TI71_9BACL|nr:2-C-methyl-D-erythritol 4-phosphate cytidylyltransferase [Paenibacillus swuensis]ANE46759.1 2-C-methyl-D-erythritol 4-phosphate cytidylyltransferase [Paenibacillus swuensis]